MWSSSFQPRLASAMNLKFCGRNFSCPFSDQQKFSTWKILGMYTLVPHGQQLGVQLAVSLLLLNTQYSEVHPHHLSPTGTTVGIKNKLLYRAVHQTFSLRGSRVWPRKTSQSLSIPMISPRFCQVLLKYYFSQTIFHARWALFLSTSITDSGHNF